MGEAKKKSKFFERFVPPALKKKRTEQEVIQDYNNRCSMIGHIVYLMQINVAQNAKHEESIQKEHIPYLTKLSTEMKAHFDEKNKPQAHETPQPSSPEPITRQGSADESERGQAEAPAKKETLLN